MTKKRAKSEPLGQSVGKSDWSVVDLFCGIGGMTHGFYLENFNVIAGLDVDESCRYAYEYNNPESKFVLANMVSHPTEKIAELYPSDSSVRIMIGCAPCQPFSTNNSKRTKSADDKWKLVDRFAEIVRDVRPHIVSMENVPNLCSFDNGKVLNGFLNTLRDSGYHVSSQVVACADYGVPQTRKRLVVLASLFGNITMLPGSFKKTDHVTVKQTIGHLEALQAGETSSGDPLHKARGLDAINLSRIRASTPGGTWEDWNEELQAKCHRDTKGSSYKSVYGRMEWAKPAPTITAQFYQYGSGRFGHPQQDRAISLREGALLQNFPYEYQFVAPGDEVVFARVGTHIGNAVPINLARAIAKSIARHLGVE